MKKKFAIWADFYRGSVFSTVLLVVVMTISLLVATYMVGFFRFFFYTRSLFQNAGLQDAVYYSLEDNYQINVFEKAEEIQRIFQQTAELPGVERVVQSRNGKAIYNGVASSTSVYDNYMKKAFPLRIFSGSWFGETSKADDIPQVVVGGDLYSNVRAGDVISLRLQDHSVTTNEMQQLTVRVVGKLAKPSYIFSLSVNGDFITTNNLLQVADMIIFEDDEKLPALLRRQEAQVSYANAFVVFEPGATEIEMKEACAHLSKKGTYTTFEQIIDDTNAYIASQIKNKGVLPLFLLFIATMSLVSISVLMVYKKLETHSIYYLCGCSRRRSFLQMFVGICSMALTSGIINIAIISLYPFLYTRGILNLGDVIIDELSIVYIFLYLVAACLLSTLLPYLTFRKYSPVDFYRRKES